MTQDLKSKKLNYYYIDRRNTLEWLKTPRRKLDKNGVLLSKIPYTNQFHYYPVDISLFALGNFEKYLDTKEKKYSLSFLDQINWLANNINIKNDFGVWYHDYELPYYKFPKKPWIHGMAQGVAISALLRGYQHTENQRYFNIAEKALHAFEKTINAGGVHYIDDNGFIWYEEYAILPPPHILNGFIFILFGIYDFFRVSKEISVLSLWNNGINTLEKNIYNYDLGFWSSYDLIHKIPSTKLYHSLHIKQLDVLFILTRKEIFRFYYKKWSNYLINPICRFFYLINRNIRHLNNYGVVGCYKRYINRRNWLNNKN